MAIEITLVDVGLAPEDGLGDPGREAFIKLNANDTNLKTAIENHVHNSGFLDRADSALTFDDGTRTFEIAPTDVSFGYWHDQTLYAVVDPESLVIPDVTGLHFFYYEEGVLKQTQVFTEAIITTYAFVALVYWNASAGKAIIVGDERHGYEMTPATHLYNHNTIGARYQNGLGLGNMDVDGDGNDATAAQFSVADGNIWDEDIQHVVADDNPQDLSPIAYIPLYHRSGASGVWVSTTATAYPVTTTGSGRAAWNEFTGGAWQLTEVGNNDFVLVHYFATNDTRNPIIGLVGQAGYPTVSAARAGALEEIHLLGLGVLDTLLPEFVAIATVIFQTGNGYGNAVKSKVRSTDGGADYIDWRASSEGSAGSGLAAHSHPVSDLLDMVINEGLAIIADDQELELTTTGQWRLAQAMTLAEVRVEVFDAPTGSVAEFDLSHNGVTVFSTLVTIDDGETTSFTATIPAVLSTTDLLNNALMIATVTALGSTFAGAGFKIRLIGEPA